MSETELIMFVQEIAPQLSAEEIIRLKNDFNKRRQEKQG